MKTGVNINLTVFFNNKATATLVVYHMRGTQRDVMNTVFTFHMRTNGVNLYGLYPISLL